MKLDALSNSEARSDRRLKKDQKKKGKKTKKRSLRERNRVNCHQHRESFERTLREALEKMANETK